MEEEFEYLYQDELEALQDLEADEGLWFITRNYIIARRFTNQYFLNARYASHHFVRLCFS